MSPQQRSTAHSSHETQASSKPHDPSDVSFSISTVMLPGFKLPQMTNPFKVEMSWKEGIDLIEEFYGPDEPLKHGDSVEPMELDLDSPVRMWAKQAAGVKTARKRLSKPVRRDVMKISSVLSNVSDPNTESMTMKGSPLGCKGLAKPDKGVFEQIKALPDLDSSILVIFPHATDSAIPPQLCKSTSLKEVTGSQYWNNTGGLEEALTETRLGQSPSTGEVDTGPHDFRIAKQDSNEQSSLMQLSTIAPGMTPAQARGTAAQQGQQTSAFTAVVVPPAPTVIKQSNARDSDGYEKPKTRSEDVTKVRRASLRSHSAKPNDGQGKAVPSSQTARRRSSARIEAIKKADQEEGEGTSEANSCSDRRTSLRSHQRAIATENKAVDEGQEIGAKKPKRGSRKTA